MLQPVPPGCGSEGHLGFSVLPRVASAACHGGSAPASRSGAREARQVCPPPVVPWTSGSGGTDLLGLKPVGLRCGRESTAPRELPFGAPRGVRATGLAARLPLRGSPGSSGSPPSSPPAVRPSGRCGWKVPGSLRANRHAHVRTFRPRAPARGSGPGSRFGSGLRARGRPRACRLRSNRVPRGRGFGRTTFGSEPRVAGRVR